MFIPDTSFLHPRIPDSNFFHPGSWICIKEFKYFNPKKRFLSSRKYDPGCSSRIRILIFYPSRIQGSKMHWIPDLQWFWSAGSRSRRSNMTHRSRKKWEKFHVLKCWLLRAEDFSCSMNVLLGGLGYRFCLKSVLHVFAIMRFINWRCRSCSNRCN